MPFPISIRASTEELQIQVSAEDTSLTLIGICKTVAETTATQIARYMWDALDSRREPSSLSRSPTLYVGEHEYGLYALPSLVDEKTVTIAVSRSNSQTLENCSNLFW